MARRKTSFTESAWWNKESYLFYYTRLKNIALSLFEYENLPVGVDPRYLELMLLENGKAVFFYDEILERHLCLGVSYAGNFDVYGNPVRRRAYSRYNNYQHQLNEQDSVVIWNDLSRLNSKDILVHYSHRLWNIDRIADVNANAQKTPYLVQCDEKERMTLLNMYKEVDGNSPVIFGGNNIDLKKLGVYSTGAPYVADRLQQLKNEIWNEALTYLGVSNVNIQKRERLITDEVSRSMGGVIACRYSREQARKQAVEEINRMFNLDIKVSFKDTMGEYQSFIKDTMEEGDDFE